MSEDKKNDIKNEKEKIQAQKRNKMPDEIGVLIGFIAIYLIFAIVCYFNGKPHFMSFDNTINILRQISLIAIVSVGMTFVIISSGIDLSVGSIIAITGVVTALVLQSTGLIFVAILAGLLAGIAVGAFNGTVVSNFMVPPFIVTLATMIGIRGLSFIVCKGRPVSVDSGFMKFIGAGDILKIPMPVIVMVVIVIISWYVANHTKFGRYVYAIGGNEEAARLSGINIKFMKTMIYSFSGLMSAIAGFILAARLMSGDPKSGVLFELDAIAAAVVGGTSLSGGRGSIIGAVFGALIIGVIANGLNILGVESYTQNLIKGAVILLAVLLDQIRKSRT